MKRRQRSMPGALQGEPVNGVEFKIMRKRLGLKQYHLAKIFGRSASHISRYETGQHRVPASVITGMVAMLANEDARVHVLTYWGIEP